MKHNFKALQTFRGWSHKDEKFVFGTFDRIGHYYDIIESETRINHSCYPESIGIYTGKDDATKWEDRPEWLENITKEDWTGVPIFAGLPEDGNMGWDRIKWSVSHWNSGGAWSAKVEEVKFKYNETLSTQGFFIPQQCEVIGTAYEQHLKDTQ